MMTLSGEWLQGSRADFLAMLYAVAFAIFPACSWAQADPAVPPNPLREGCGLQVSKLFLPNLDIELIDSKFFDCENGTIQSVVADANGNEIDVDELLRAETKAREANPLAKIDQDLLVQLADKPNKRRPVIVWLALDTERLDAYARALLEPRAPPFAEPPAYDEAKLLSVKDELLNFNRSVISQVTNDFAGRVKNKILYVGEYSPVVVVRANADEVHELARLARVDTLYPDLFSSELNFEGLIAHRVLPDWPNAGFGWGRKVAVLEGERIEPGFYLQVEETFRPGATIDRGHPQLVAGVIQSRWFRRPGTAPLARLFSANVGTVAGCESPTAIRDCGVTQGTDWVIEHRVDVTNLSWGGPLIPEGDFFRNVADGEMHYLDRFFDHNARYNLHTFVAGAGNDASDFVHSPATAWNVIAVGAVTTSPQDPEDPEAPDPDPADWSNDVMNPDYAYDNPLNGNNKPNVAARGTRVLSLGSPSTGWAALPNSGTSLSAPFVSATAALAMNRNPTLLAAPETVMATIMASAWNNIEGPDDRPISGLDGAGGIHTSAATRTAGNYRSIYTYVNPASVSDRGYKPIPIELVAGERTRIAVSWFADTAVPVHEIGYIQTDIDVLVYEGPPTATGFIRGFSVSKFNNTELIDFVPEVSGTHTIALYTPRQIGYRNDRVGIAVSRYDVDTLE